MWERHAPQYAISGLGALAAAVSLAFGSQTALATVATNFTIVNHATRQPLSLYQYQGSVILLDFWAYWCGPCQEGASDVEPNIARYYKNAGGNKNGVPVTVICISIDMGDLTQENNFIQTYGLGLVGDDTSGVAFNQFGQGYIPQFVVINGATNSINYGAWQVLYNPYGYATNSTVPALKSYIDAVQTPAPIGTVTNPADGVIVAPPSVTLGADVVTKGKIIKHVDFYNGATLLGSSTNAPYSLTWSNVAVGAKSVFARTCYGTSSSVDSPAVNFTVAAPVMATLCAQGANLVLNWTGGTGNFQVQTTTNLAGGVWQNCGAAGTGTNLVIAPGNQARFYRVRWP